MFCLAHLWLASCQSTPLFFFDIIMEWIFGILRHIEIRFDLLHLMSCFHGLQVQWVAHGLNGCVLCCSQNYSHGFVLYPVELQQVRLWHSCETQTIVNDVDYHTLIQQEQMTLFDAFWSHGFQCRQSFLAPEFCWFDLRLVCQHSVEVDPEVSETVRAFYDFSIEGNCWHCLSYSFVLEGAPQGLWLAWIDFGLCLLAPMWHFSQLLLDSNDCCVCHWLFCR